MNPLYDEYGCSPVDVPTTTFSSPITQSGYLLQQLTSIHKELTENLINATQTYKHHAKKKRRPYHSLEVRSKVYLDAKNLKVR